MPAKCAVEPLACASASALTGELSWQKGAFEPLALSASALGAEAKNPGAQSISLTVRVRSWRGDSASKSCLA